MNIETDDWLPLSEACKFAGLPQANGYRLVKSLGIIESIVGVNVIGLADVKTLAEKRRKPGNPNWNESWEGAAADGV